MRKSYALKDAYLYTAASSTGGETPFALADIISGHKMKSGDLRARWSVVIIKTRSLRRNG